MGNVADDTRSTASTPRHSATVMLLREAHSQTEVLLVRRHANLAFMGGMWVFPGGVLSPADASPDALALITDSGAFSCRRMRSAQGKPLPASECLGLAIAACRETFEETGVLLARHEDGRPCDPQVAVRLHAQRTLVVEQPARFPRLLARERLHPDVSRLIYWAHWITPSSSPRRYDTRFFLVAAPPLQSVITDAGELDGTAETIDSVWLRPADLIAAARRGTMPISNPTLFNLLELQATLLQHGSLDALLHQEAARTVVPVLPKSLRDGGSATVLLPWDQDYDSAPGEGIALDSGYRGALRELPSRFVV